MKSHGSDVRVLAVVPEHMREELLLQLAPLDMTVVCAGRALDVVRLINRGAIFHVVIVPAASFPADTSPALPSDDEWWALWGELSLFDPRPEILVYARANTFQLWTGVLDVGGFDVVVHPFSDLAIQKAVLRAVQWFKERPRRNRAAQ